jgi:hypothetical protein
LEIGLLFDRIIFITRSSFSWQADWILANPVPKIDNEQSHGVQRYSDADAEQPYERVLRILPPAIISPRIMEIQNFQFPGIMFL